MMSVGGDRDRSSRALAEEALVRLGAAAGARSAELVLIGGLVPELLVPSDEPHQGTTDVDILLDIGVVYDRDDRDFGWLERALAAAGFVQQNPNTGWRWAVEIDALPVTVEFLVDVSDNLDQEIALPGTRGLGAKNLSGPGPVLRGPRVMELRGTEIRVAGLGGYLTAKAAAVFRRRASKDFYDFAWVLVRSVRVDPVAAAESVLGVLSPEIDRDRFQIVLAACEDFREATSTGAIAYAKGSEQAGSTEPAERLAADAVIAVGRFRRELLRNN